ncbi:MAG TPA: rhomboid family intramembrane serine protease [Acholeplasmataceae bacterium]|nr:rhomboid family intramembrane serine protease [Acholeplasmataceae bacterium]
MKFINKLERKIGKYAIQNLMTYIIILYAMGTVIYIADYRLLSLLNFNIDKILQGQVWRLVTFLIQPISSGNILFVFIELYLYYMIGNSLENVWGAFRFNLYFFSGVLFNIFSVVIIYFITKINPNTQVLSLGINLVYINRAMFFAFAVIYPDLKFLLFFIIPVKVKYLAMVYGGFMGIEFIQFAIFAIKGDIYSLALAISIIVALANFLIFFIFVSNFKRISPREIKRKINYKNNMKVVKDQGHHVKVDGKTIVTRHKCTICGITEHDDYMIEFRFCSKCNGNYEYCMEHLFTHEHIK